jgi:hypothetical protein
MTVIRTKLLLLCTSLIFSTAAIRAADVPQWVDLFNCKGLTGWVDVNTSPDTWSVKDGLYLTNLLGVRSCPRLRFL